MSNQVFSLFLNNFAIYLRNSNVEADAGTDRFSSSVALAQYRCSALAWHEGYPLNRVVFPARQLEFLHPIAGSSKFVLGTDTSVKYSLSTLTASQKEKSQRLGSWLSWKTQISL